MFPIYLKRHLCIFGQKHESLHPPWCYVHLSISSTASLTHFQKSKCFKKIGLFNLNYFWTFQIRKRRLGKTILGTEVVKIWINFFHFFKNILLKLFYLIQLEMMFFCQKFLLLVHSYFVKIFLKCILKYIEILFSRYPCLFLTTCVFQKLPFLIIRFKRHLCIFFQNMRVVPSSREAMCSCQIQKSLIISS